MDLLLENEIYVHNARTSIVIPE